MDDKTKIGSKHAPEEHRAPPGNIPQGGRPGGGHPTMDPDHQPGQQAKQDDRTEMSKHQDKSAAHPDRGKAKH